MQGCQRRKVEHKLCIYSTTESEETEDIFSRPPACISAPPSPPRSAVAVAGANGAGGVGTNPNSHHPHNQGSLASTVTASLVVLFSAGFIAV